MNISWETKKYASQFNFVPQYGKGVMDLITAPAGSRVLDLGCGNGTLTKQLADAGFEVRGIDASPEFIKLARTTYPNLIFEEGDATDFHLQNKVNVIFSNAVFHWIDRDKQPKMIHCIADALVEKGELVCEFGGYGNNALIHHALQQEFAKHGLSYHMPFYFPTIGEYAPLLEQEGLQVRFATLFDRKTELKGEDGLADWIRMFVKTPFEGMEVSLKECILRDTVQSLEPTLHQDGKWYADYVRLRIRAVKTHE